MSQNFTINQGESVSLPFYWYSGSPVFKAISAITLAYPPVFTATSHGMPDDEIPVTLVGIRGPKQLNTPEGKTVYALKTSANAFSVPELNASGLATYTTVGGTGYVRYVAPKDITGYTARMQARNPPSSATKILDLTSEDGELVLGTTDGKTVLTLTATATALLDFITAEYDLELVSGAGIVTRIASGIITLDKEVTR